MKLFGYTKADAARVKASKIIIKRIERTMFEILLQKGKDMNKGQCKFLNYEENLCALSTLLGEI
jgi:hypothetical protein